MIFFGQLFDPARRFERRYAEQLVARFQYVPWPDGTRIGLDYEFIPVRALDAALACNAQMVLIGGAGAGKTTALAHLALSHARALLSDRHDARVPIFLSARDGALGALPRVADLPRALSRTQCPRDFFANVFAAGRALVLVDDIDALPPAQAEAWLQQFANARVVAASKSAVPRFAEFPLPGFRDGVIEAFARAWDSQKAEKFLSALKAGAVPRALTANPFTLTLQTRVWRADQPLPTRRTELFDAYAQNVVGDANETTKMLEGVALALQRGSAASNVFLPKGCGFLRASNNRTVEFIHELWQAYFAARALRHAPDVEALSEALHDPRWQDTVLFYAGWGDASELIDTILARGDMFLAGRALAHAREVRTDLRDAVTKELVGSAWEGERRAVAVLSEMNSAVAIDGFAARLKDNDPAVRTRAIEILGQLRLDRGIDYLLPQLRDVSGDVRDKVVEALGRSRTDRVIEPLLVALRGDPRVGRMDTRLRIAAAKALGEVGSDKAVPALIVDLQVGEPEVRAVAAESLKRIKSPLMFKPLRGILEAGDEEARRYAAEILASLAGKNHP